MVYDVRYPVRVPSRFMTLDIQVLYLHVYDVRYPGIVPSRFMKLDIQLLYLHVLYLHGL
jgi:hypothetical protein